MARRKMQVELDPQVRPFPVEYEGHHLMAMRTGKVNGVASILLYGGTTFWVPLSEVRDID